MNDNITIGHASWSPDFKSIKRPPKLKSESPSRAVPCSRREDTPETDAKLNDCENRGADYIAIILGEHARKLERELARYREREKHCATMDEAEKLALILTIQEIGDVVCLSGLASSPAEIVAAVRNLQANAHCPSVDATETKMKL